MSRQEAIEARRQKVYEELLDGDPNFRIYARNCKGLTPWQIVSGWRKEQADQEDSARLWGAKGGVRQRTVFFNGGLRGNNEL